MDSFVFVIRFSTGIPDVRIPIPDLAAVSTGWLKKQIRRLTPSTTGNKRLKLIYSGRVLVNDTNYARDVLVKHHYDDDEQEEEEGPTPVYVHCLIGDELSPEELAHEDEQDNKQPETTTTPAPIGFDRLLSQGFSQQDVLELREQFRRIHAGYLREQHSIEDIRQLEDRWIDSTVNNEFDEFAAGTGVSMGTTTHDSDANRDLLVGILLGCFLGVFALFLLKLELGDVFNNRTRMAVVAGAFVNLSFGLFKAWS